MKNEVIEKENNLLIWAGKTDFKILDELEAYVNVTYNKLGDDLPSEFMKEFNIPEYDIGYEEINFFQHYKSFRGAAKLHSYSETFLEAAEKAALKKGVNFINTIIIIYDHQFESSKSIEFGGDKKITFIGSFGFEKIDPLYD